MNQSTNSYIIEEDTVIGDLLFHKSELTLYGKLIRYDRLNYLLKLAMGNTLINSINVFIDFHQMLYTLYRFNMVSDPMGILASMVNMILHYRHFFNKQNIKSNIFIIFSTNNSSNNTKYIANYNSANINKRERNVDIKDIIDHNIELMKTLIPYFPGIYLKLSTVEPSVVMYDLINKISKEDKSPCLIISSSDYSYQLPAVLKNTYLIYKKTMMNKTNIEDVSFIVVHDNALLTYISKTKNQQVSIDDLQDSLLLNQNWISPFMILTGLQCRSIKGLFNYKKALEILKFIKQNFEIITPESLYNAIIDLNYKNPIKLQKQEIIDRYCALDLDYQLKLYRELPESVEVSWLQDLYDPQTLYDITNMYFKGQNKIDLSKI